ncbi:MAG: FMN-binding protein [Clostridiales bacterium]|nr:FMN-binding protein [Clostridiales bacterium]
MKDNRLKGIIALAVVTIVSFGIVFGSKALTKTETPNTDTTEVPVEGSIDVAGAEGIKAARELTDGSGTVTGYAVQAAAKGFAGDVTLEVTFATDGKTIEGVTVVSHRETPGYGAEMESNDYFSQFNGITAPVYLPGNAPAADTNDVAEEVATGEETALKDGVYTVTADEVDGGFLFSLTLKVENGAVTSVVWDAVNEVGEYKSYLSSVGKYVMTEDGPTWKEQADALAAQVIADQSSEGIVIGDEGKTDSVAGVSISVDGFTNLVEKALQMAATGEGSADSETSGDTAGGSTAAATEIDAISGATMTSTAIETLINYAYEFINGYVNK